MPNTYSNNFSASMNSPVNPWGWSLSYNRSYYDNGLTRCRQRRQRRTSWTSATTYNSFLGKLIYQIDPQLQVSLRGGYDSYKFAAPTIESARYGIGFQWNPTDRTQVGGFWDHTFFGSSYSLQVEPPAAQCRAQREPVARPHQLSRARPGHSRGRRGQPVRERRLRDPDTGSCGAGDGGRAVPGTDAVGADAGELR